MPDLKNDSRVLVSITTTYGSDWRNKFREANEQSITECALFPTTLSKEDRKEYFGLLEKSSIKSCPFVHLRSDMTVDEMDYLAENFGTKVFNTHCRAEYPRVSDWSKYADRIYIENVYHAFNPEEMKDWAGICFDVSHLENDRRQNPERFAQILKALDQYPIGCNHISGIAEQLRVNSEGEQRFDKHRFDSLREFDYLKNYPGKYFSRFCAIEVVNTLKEQLAAKKYIETILAGI
jgi:hypothetical protein